MVTAFIRVGGMNLMSRRVSGRDEIVLQKLERISRAPCGAAPAPPGLIHSAFSCFAFRRLLPALPGPRL